MKKRILAILSVLAISLCCVLAACQSEKDLTLSGYDKDGLERVRQGVRSFLGGHDRV